MSNEDMKNKIAKIYAWFFGVKKGVRFILYQSGFKNKDGGGIVCWAEIEYVCSEFVSIKLYNHDDKFASEIGQSNVYIGKDFYNWGAYPLKQVRAFLKAQDLLKSQFTMLLKPF